MKTIMPDQSDLPDHSRTPTEVLVACFEDFGQSEPERVLVIYVNADHELVWSWSGGYHYTHLLGMIECVRAKIMARFMED